MPKGTFSDFEGLRYLRLIQKGEKFSSPHPCVLCLISLVYCN